MTEKTFASALVAITCLAGCETYVLDPPPADIVRADADDVVDPQELVVVAGTPSSVDSLTTKAQRRGYVIRSRETLEALDMILLTVGLPVGQSGGAAIRELEALEPGVTAGVNHAYRPQGAPGARSYAPALMKWDEKGCAAHERIGLIDTALDMSQFETRADRITSLDLSRRPGAQEPSDHATAITALLLDDTLLENATVFHVDAVSAEARTGSAASVDSIMRALDRLLSADVRLINVSLAGPYNKILDRGVQSAAAKGAVIVAAAGNAGPDGPPRYPAGFDDTLAVTAVDVSGGLYAKAVVGRQIDFAAPGVDVFVPTADGGAYHSGTSIASPFVALRIAGDPAALTAGTVGALKSYLAETSVDLGAPGPDERFGHGLIRAPAPCRSNG